MEFELAIVKSNIEKSISLLRRYLDWDNAEARLINLTKECEDPELWNNTAKAQKLLREKSYLENSIATVKHIEKETANLIELFVLSELDNDQSTINEVKKELLVLEKSAKQKEIECLFSGEADHNDAFLEIHSGAGGTESHDWASILYRMYTRWAEKHKFKIEIVDYLAGEEAGIKTVTMKITGENVYGWLKTESGVHRLVRISPFNAAGKRHTSFASAWVFPVIDDSIEISINESDLRIDTFRSSGAGGQHVNTTDSAVRITHIPSGIVVSSQTNRSQHRNRDECMSMLKSRLYERELKKKEEKINQMNAAKTDIGWGHQIRSYVLQPYQMVKDLRTGYSSPEPSAVLDGELDEFILRSLEAKMSGQGLEPQFDTE
ncbi:peptide chain release factor 2 [Candidatus Jidaibacter acanthamoebae]|uniref:peptide chain release factor 2 n=1 Tax=Candidatus Jidaibacter acanthamoebae TaxID=86105 RepID=UPI00126A0220|nr:peptide chain release factor 2 [Candidatus Jidaibacter acanthamoeba]